MINGKVANCLDEVLLDEDIGGFVGMFLFDSVDDINNNSNVQLNILTKLLILLKTIPFVMSGMVYVVKALPITTIV